MAVVLKALLNAYNDWFYELRDPRTDGFLLVGSPVPVLVILASYYYFVTDFGPKFMEKRPPFDLKRVIIVYNLVQILANLYIVLQGCMALKWFSLWCSPVDYSTNERALFLLNLAWIYYVIKISDLLDTVFFVLRKKNNQISFLHLYHHSMMLFVAWFGTRYIGGGHSMYVGFLNSAVHVVMYTYYLLTAYDSSYKQNLWWKKYITLLQILQFFLLCLIFTPPALDSSCTYPKVLIWILLPQNFLMIVLFVQFYYAAYIKPKIKAN